MELGAGTWHTSGLITSHHSHETTHRTNKANHGPELHSCSETFLMWDDVLASPSGQVRHMIDFKGIEMCQTFFFLKFYYFINLYIILKDDSSMGGIFLCVVNLKLIQNIKGE